MTSRLTVLGLCLGVSLTVAGCHHGSEGEGGKAASAKQEVSEKKSGSDASAGGTNAGAQQDTSVPTDTVRIARDDQPRAGIRVASVIVRAMPSALSVAGEVAMDERRTDHIGALADGRVERVYVLPGDGVRRGQTLATLHSHLIHETVASLTQAFAAVARQQSAVMFATQARDRYGRLYGIQAASLEEKQRSEQDLAEAQKDLIDAEANLRQEREHLSELLQVSPESLQPGTLLNRELIPVRALTDGVVIARSITAGQVVNTGDELFITSNLSTVWVMAAVNERDVPGVHAGQSVTVTLQSADGRGLPGKVTMVGDIVDPQTRTLPVRVSVPNPGVRLKPGMFVTAAVSQEATHTTIFVPQNALQDVNGFRVVFATSDGVNFQARVVKTGERTGDLVEITEGLRPTDHIVVDGAFMVKGELLKGTVGEG